MIHPTRPLVSKGLNVAVRLGRVHILWQIGPTVGVEPLCDDLTGGKYVVGVMVVMHAQNHLFNIIQTPRLVCGFTSALHRRKENRHENGDDGDHDEELNQSEPPRLSTKRTHKNLPC